MKSVRGSPAQSWLRAIELTSQVDSDPRCLFADLIEDWARKHPQRLALVSEDESVSYRALSDRIHRYARWALSVGITPGDRVGLIMSTRPDYIRHGLGYAKLVV